MITENIEKFLKSVGESFNEKTKSEEIAIIIENTRYTYSELYKISIEISTAINQINSTSHLIGVYTDNNIYTYAAIIGVLLSGKGFVPLNNKFPDKRLSNIIEQTGLELILGCEESKNRITQLKSEIELIVIDKTNRVKEEFKFILAPKNSIAYVLFTSGSTGEPKGISISYENFNSFLSPLCEKFPLNNDNKVLQCFELSFDVAIGCTFLAFSTSATLVVSSLKGIIAVNAFKSIIDYNVDFVVIAPSVVGYLVNYKLIPQYKVPNIKTTLFTGEALLFSQVLKWKESAENTRVINAYGPTEATVWSYFYQINENTPNEIINDLCPIGSPIKNIIPRIDETSSDGKGELQLRGKQVFDSYWKNPKKTEESFAIDNEFRWYKTGDLVSKNKYGNIVYLARLDNQVKINGYRIELGEIEYAINSILNTTTSVVVVGTDVKGNKMLTAFIGVSFNQKDLLEELSKTLTFYMLPKQFNYVKDIPLNSNGKIDRKLLKLKANGNSN